MTEQPTATPKGFSIAALIAGLGSVALILVFLLTETGPPIMIAGVVLGIAAVILGIIAITKRQPKALALVGIITGAVAVLAALALFVFALLFLGAFMSESPYR